LHFFSHRFELCGWFCQHWLIVALGIVQTCVHSKKKEEEKKCKKHMEISLKEFLISQVKNCSSIWDLSHHDYMKGNIKTNCWLNILKDLRNAFDKQVLEDHNVNSVAATVSTVAASKECQLLVAGDQAEVSKFGEKRKEERLVIFCLRKLRDKRLCFLAKNHFQIWAQTIFARKNVIFKL